MMRETADARPFPRALAAPEGTSVTIDGALVAQAIDASRASPRRRVILPFHQSAEDTLHRMLNVVQPGSYIRPHRHLDPPKAETIILLQGGLRYLEFTAAGEVSRVVTLSPATGNVGMDTRAGVFHTFLALEPDTVVFEAKPGPYQANTDKDFAAWAPPEGSEHAATYLRWLEEIDRSPAGLP